MGCWEAGKQKGTVGRGGPGMGPALPPVGPGRCSLGFLLSETISGAGVGGGVISWLKSRLLAVTSLASPAAGKTVVGEGAVGASRQRWGSVPQGWLPLGCWLPVPRAPSSPWLGLVGGHPHSPSGGRTACCPRSGVRMGAGWGRRELVGSGMFQSACLPHTDAWESVLPGLSFPTCQGRGWPE